MTVLGLEKTEANSDFLQDKAPKLTYSLNKHYTN